VVRSVEIEALGVEVIEKRIQFERGDRLHQYRVVKRLGRIGQFGEHGRFLGRGSSLR
jgi:hypothetical protein